MKIRQVQIDRFRGIRSLDWVLQGNFVCLIGPGDSTKTTILDAIELALSPRWNVQFDDADFLDMQPAAGFLIKVTVGDLPEEMKSDAKFGLCARGWSPSGGLHDEPKDGDELVLTIRLSVDASLEPTWGVINDRCADGKPISAKDREKLSCSRLGDYLDKHFSWARGSILTRLTGSVDNLSGILAQAGRAARGALSDLPPEDLPNLHQAAREAKRLGGIFGVASETEYRPHLDVQAVSAGLSGISLHAGEVPLRRAGLGTRRLVAAAMHWHAGKAGGVTLVDEIEHGLEPHRIRHLIRVFAKTHSPVRDCAHMKPPTQVRRKGAQTPTRGKAESALRTAAGGEGGRVGSTTLRRAGPRPDPPIVDGLRDPELACGHAHPPSDLEPLPDGRHDLRPLLGCETLWAASHQCSSSRGRR